MEIGMPKKVHEVEVVPGWEPVPTFIPIEEPAHEDDPLPTQPEFVPA